MAYGQVETHKCERCRRELPLFRVGKGLYRDSVVYRHSPVDDWMDNPPRMWLCGKCLTELDPDYD